MANHVRLASKRLHLGKRFQCRGAFFDSDKNDGNDAEAICEAVTRPNMRFVPVKSTEQQALLVMHRVRQGFVVERTALINRLRGLLSEFGVVLALRSVTVRREAAQAAERLPQLARRGIIDLLDQLRQLDERIDAYDREIEAQARLSEPARRLMKIRGIGATTALAIVRRLATLESSKTAASSPPGSAWCPVSIPLGARRALGISASAATPTCEICWSRERAQCCAARRGTPFG